MKLKVNMKSVVVLTVLASIVQGCAFGPSLPSSSSRGKNTSSLTDGFLVENPYAEPLNSKTEVRPGFQIQMTSAVDEKLSGDYRVDINGEIKLPYGGWTRAAGLTLSALQDKINAEVRKFYKADPQVSLKILDRKYYIEVRGLIQKPGVILVSEFEKIESVIKKAGEFSLTKEARVVQINRGQNSYYMDLAEYFQGHDMNLSPKWYGGEKVFFTQASIGEENSASVQILGDVRNPGAMSFKDSMNLYQYINKAGGPTQSTDLDRITVVRQTSKGPVKTEGTAEEIAKEIKLQAGDTVYVHSSNSTTLERRLGMVSSFMSVITAIAFLIIAF